MCFRFRATASKFLDGVPIGTNGAATTYRGFENDFDPHALFMNIGTLGLRVKPYDKLAGVKYPSVGLFQAEYFEPMKYKFNRPNPAFERMTKRDGYWAAKLIMSLTDEQLWAAVEVELAEFYK